jgi:hypothetical protein
MISGFLSINGAEFYREINFHSPKAAKNDYNEEGALGHVKIYRFFINTYCHRLGTVFLFTAARE